jgi:hypothetical protein
VLGRGPSWRADHQARHPAPVRVRE